MSEQNCIDRPTDPEDLALWQSLHSFVDAEKRWAALRRQGVSDPDLQQAISEEYGTAGGFTGPGMLSWRVKGGEIPKFWLDLTERGKPTLQGRSLVKEARRVLALSFPDNLPVASSTPVQNRPDIGDIAGQPREANQLQLTLFT